MSTFRKVVVVTGSTVLALAAVAAPASAAPTNTCNGDMHTNLWNVSLSKERGETPGQVVKETAHRDHGLGTVLGWWGPFAANVICKS